LATSKACWHRSSKLALGAKLARIFSATLLNRFSSAASFVFSLGLPLLLAGVATELAWATVITSVVPRELEAPGLPVVEFPPTELPELPEVELPVGELEEPEAIGYASPAGRKLLLLAGAWPY
jgi:hypothetical protein